MKKAIKTLFLTVLAISLVSCASAGKLTVSTEEQAEKPLVDCNMFEAWRRLGPPDHGNFSTFYKMSFHYFMTWVYPEKDLYVYLTDGKVCKTQRISDTSNSAYYLSVIKKKR